MAKTDAKIPGPPAFLLRPAQALLGSGAKLLAVLSVISLFAAFHPIADNLASLRHLFALGASMTAIGLIGLHRKVTALVALGTLVLNLVLIADAYLPRAPGCQANLTVVTLNAQGRHNDVAATLRQLERVDADLVVVTEVGKALDGALQRRYSHYFSFPHDGTHGMGLYSHFVLRDSQKQDDARSPFPFLVTTLAQHGRILTVLAVHPLPPMTAAQARARNDTIREIAKRVEAREGSVILAGDLNATRQSPHLEPLFDAGLVDTRAGRGVLGTWPVWSPFRVGIDHILHTPDLQTCSLQSGAATGSDHLPLIARIRR